MQPEKRLDQFPAPAASPHLRLSALQSAPGRVCSGTTRRPGSARARLVNTATMQTLAPKEVDHQLGASLVEEASVWEKETKPI